VRDLDIDLIRAKALFASVQQGPYVIIEVSEEAAVDMVKMLPSPFRQFYVSDDDLDEAHAKFQISKKELIELKLPNAGSVMAGDFGEMLTAVMQGALEHPVEVIDPKKWRYKQDRTKPAPKYDVVQFVLPNWPDSSEQDRLFCSEVKAKALKGKSTPVESAISDSSKDRDGRLASTLSWLREKAIFAGDVPTVEQLNRFIKADAHPQASFEYRAVAIISADLVISETSVITGQLLGDNVLIVVSIPNLKSVYTAVFDAISQTVTQPASGAVDSEDA
jgi:hypothetical protein